MARPPQLGFLTEGSIASSRRVHSDYRTKLRDDSETVYLKITLLNLESKPLALGLKLTYFAFEGRCLAVASRKLPYEQRKSVPLNEQRAILLNKSLHDNCGSDVFCHSCAR